jgi:type IV secretion system protein VirB5
MRFKRTLHRYGRTPEPETPYQRAMQVWDERIGSARVQARNWRLMAFGCLGLAGAFSGGLLWQSMQSRVVPYVVEVDRLGEARAVSPAERAYEPTDPQISWFLAQFIRDVRSLSLDPVLMRENWLSAYDFVTDRGARFLGDYARSSSPFDDVGRRTIAVQVTSVVRASDRSFQVKWTETAYERGNLAGTSHWTAILSLAMRPPRTADTLRKNPLGLYVDGIDWSKELEPAGQGASSAGTRPAAGSPPTTAMPDWLPQGSPLDPKPAAPAAPLPAERTPQ